MLARIQVVRGRGPLRRGRSIKVARPAGGSATRAVRVVLVVWPKPGPGRLLAWRLSHVLVRATLGPPPPPPTWILALVMAANRQMELAMASRNTLFLSMTSTNILNLVIHGS